MKHLLLLLLLLATRSAFAQGENNNWNFSMNLGFQFLPSGPVFRSSAMLGASESSSTISDANGQELFYTDGVKVWDRMGQRMTNACATCDGAAGMLAGNTSSAQGALIVQRPGSTTRYYIFVTDCQENLYRGGLTYTEVDMTLRGGLGGITDVQNVRLPTPVATSSGPITEGVVGMQHVNRRDTWVVVHGRNDSFYSFLVTSAGIGTVPVVSRSGSPNNRLSFMKFSPSGRQLARCGGWISDTELFDFDGATGVISNRQTLAEATNDIIVHDLEFSPDGNKLYVQESLMKTSSTFELFLNQYDLRAGSTAAIRSSKLFVAEPPAAVNIYLGPDGRIYTSAAPHVGVIDRPNRRGTAAGYRAIGVPHLTTNGCIALQNLVRPQPPALDYMVETACAGSVVEFTPYEVPSGTGPLTWTFHDPRTGQTDSVQATTVRRAYPTAGTFDVTLSTTSRGQYYRFPRTVIISPLPTVTLSTNTVALCAGTKLLSIPTPPLGSTIRWSDGSSGVNIQVDKPGKYWVEVRNYQGCVSADTAVAVACKIPNIITPNNDGQNDAFHPQGLRAGAWNLDVFNRWGRLVYQQKGYDNRWDAAGLADGIYFFQLTNPASGQQLKGHVEVVR